MPVAIRNLSSTKRSAPFLGVVKKTCPRMSMLCATWSLDKQRGSAVTDCLIVPSSGASDWWPGILATG